MEATKPVVFIGSASESADVADAIAKLLPDTVEIKAWNTGVFEISGKQLDSLVDALKRSDYAIFVISGDDKVETRGTNFFTARDNVLFEAGICFGSIEVAPQN